MKDISRQLKARNTSSTIRNHKNPNKENKSKIIKKNATNEKHKFQIYLKTIWILCHDLDFSPQHFLCCCCFLLGNYKKRWIIKEQTHQKHCPSHKNCQDKLHLCAVQKKQDRWLMTSRDNLQVQILFVSLVKRYKFLQITQLEQQ